MSMSKKRYKNREFKRGVSPSSHFFPLSFEGEGD